MLTKNALLKNSVISAVLFFFFSANVMAAKTITKATSGGLYDLGGNIFGLSDLAYQLIVVVAGLIGIGFIVSAFIQMKGAKQNNTGYGQPVILAVIGFVLLSIVAFVSAGSSSMFGGGAGFDGGNSISTFGKKP